MLVHAFQQQQQPFLQPVVPQQYLQPVLPLHPFVAAGVSVQAEPGRDPGSMFDGSMPRPMLQHQVAIINSIQINPVFNLILVPSGTCGFSCF